MNKKLTKKQLYYACRLYPRVHNFEPCTVRKKLEKFTRAMIKEFGAKFYENKEPVWGYFPPLIKFQRDQLKKWGIVK